MYTERLKEGGWKSFSNIEGYEEKWVRYIVWENGTEGGYYEGRLGMRNWRSFGGYVINREGGKSRIIVNTC